METLSQFIELELKYRVEGSLVYAFKGLVSNIPGLKNFSYIESTDIYYVNDEAESLRHRFNPKNIKDRQEVTFKRKINPANNIHREETNVRVDGNTVETIADLANKLKFKKNFSLNKFVHLYHFEDATIPFYTVIDEEGKLQHFIEIEVKEEIISTLTEDQAWSILERYERLLKPLGISAQNRLKKSLFEMYRR